jgi:hypothetical protein
MTFLEKLLTLKINALLPSLQSKLENPVNHIKFNNSPTNVPNEAGVTYWDDQDKTISTNLGSGVILQHGQEMYIKAVNKTNATIPNGSVVYVSGAQGNRPKIALASSTDLDNSMKVIGVVTSDILNNEYGFVTISGLVRDLDTNAFEEGDCLYLSDTPGQLTKTIPAIGKARILVAMCVKKHVTDGWLCVRVSNDKYMFGDPVNGNYGYFNDVGALVLKGDAVNWRDEYVGGEYFTPTGSTAPDIVDATIGGVVTRKWSFDGSATIEKLGNSFETPHDMDYISVNAGTKSIEFHIHAGPSDNNSGNVRFVVDWALLKAQGSGSRIISGTQLVLTKTFTSNNQYTNYIFGANLTLPTGGFSIGDIIEFTISRTPSDVADTYASDTIFYKCALHVPVDMLGSSQTYSK